MPSLKYFDLRYLAGAAALVIAVVALGLAVGHRPFTLADGEVLEEFVERRNGEATAVMKLITTVFSPAGTIVIGLGIAALLAWRKSVAAAVFVLGSTAAASALTLILKATFARQRPPVVDHLTAESDYGFPSGHVTGTTALLVATTVAVTVGWTNRWRLLAFVVPTAVIGAVASSRLYLGVHWFSDTAAGFIIGVAGVGIGLAVLPPDSWSTRDDAVATLMGRRRGRRTPISQRLSR